MAKTIKGKDKEILEARHKLWRMGVLEWKLDTTQKELYHFFHDNSHKVTVWTASRRLGKSFALTILALEQCIKEPKSIVKFIQPEQKMIRMNIRPVMDEIIEDCPDDIKPEFNKQDAVYYFKNGSQIQLAGTDNQNHEKLRGSNANLCLVDEAGYCSDLRYIINSILIPLTTLTKGKIVLSSTPPKDINHEFIKYMDLGEQNGTGVVRTIWDAVENEKDRPDARIRPEHVHEIIASLPGGDKSDDFQREYLCKISRENDSMVIPEFTDEIMQDTVVEWPRPPFFTNYTGMDIGFKDLTVALFAYHDFENGVIVVEDELVISGPKMTTEVLAAEIRKKEEIQWSHKLTGEFKAPYLRVSDNNLIVINDLQKLHGLTFLPTKKDNKDVQINQLRMMIAARQIIINPRCKVLIQHLKGATWNVKRDDFTRSADNGHYDALSALIYLVRNIDLNRNPFPPGYRKYGHIAKSDLFFGNNRKEEKYQKFKDIFKFKSSINIKNNK